jgi:hypothetical protein
MAVGEPFAFCGRIVEAYYTNAEQDSVSILWTDGEKNRDYHLKVDEEDDQFKALLDEFSYESIDECTLRKNELGRQWWRDAFNDYAQTMELSFETPEERQADLSLIFDFDPEIPEQKEALFKLKLQMFEQDIVKNSKSKVQKTTIRKASTPIEAIVAYNKFIKK